jgi:hypothetical protein
MLGSAFCSMPAVTGAKLPVQAFSRAVQEGSTMRGKEDILRREKQF